MIEYFNTNQDAFWFSLGFLLLIIEAFAFGFSTGVVLFAGLGGLITGALMWAGLVPQTWLAGVACFGVSSGISAALLWKVLLKLQNVDVPEKDNSSDLIGHAFRLQEMISHTAPGRLHFSGVDWRVEIDDGKTAMAEIAAGTRVVVTSVDAGLFRVIPAPEEVTP